jgi:hypothetical protein
MASFLMEKALTQETLNLSSVNFVNQIMQIWCILYWCNYFSSYFLKLQESFANVVWEVCFTKRYFPFFVHISSCCTPSISY